MGGSQALTVSVFGTIKRRGDLQLLTEILDSSERPLLPNFELDFQPKFDYEIRKLQEPTPTRVDFYIPCRSGNVAIECKLWETELGPCSRVASGKCDGNYAQHIGARSGERCNLTKRGVAYCRHIPRLFRWSATIDHCPCPSSEGDQAATSSDLDNRHDGHQAWMAVASGVGSIPCSST